MAEAEEAFDGGELPRLRDWRQAGIAQSVGECRQIAEGYAGQGLFRVSLAYAMLSIRRENDNEDQ